MKMKKISLLFLLVFQCLAVFCQKEEKRNDYYITNQSPLVSQPYTALSLGSIKPKGWLLEMLEIQKEGLTGNLDSIYEVVCGSNNGWLGGTGDGWERGPYWLDGLVPLAYILDDEHLKAKAQKWIEWSINNQREDGYFGPQPLPDGYIKIPGIQQDKREDWWPKMVMLKVLQQYYSATQDKRVIALMDKYFRYQLGKLHEFPLGHWSYWANRRGGDNLALVYWLYNITREKYLLELAEILFEQTYNWTQVYSGTQIASLNPLPHLHCVNVAQGLKQPVIYYQRHPEGRYLEAVKKGLSSLKQAHGVVSGMYGGDERLHGNDPTQGSELCSAVEMMYSFENILPITGDVYYADYLEKIAFNVLPTQHDDQFMRRQYFQQANQVLVTDVKRNFFNDEKGRIVYGLLTGYPCCTTNMHQGWPKFVQNLWYATADNGLAALVYGASEVRATVGKGEVVKLVQKTDYPFRDKIQISYETDKIVKFPLHLRIPGWCENPQIKVAGKLWTFDEKDKIVVIDRFWKKGDEIELHFPMKIRISEWAQNSRGVERGPLVYALKIEEKWREVRKAPWKHSFLEVEPKSDWNYGLFMNQLKGDFFKVKENGPVASMPWNLQNAPVIIETKGAKIPSWQLYNNSVGMIPVRTVFGVNSADQSERITLVPYGCTTLRISQFPLIRIPPKK